jgi:uncharacterized protein (TIRG00374 family)
VDADGVVRVLAFARFDGFAARTLPKSPVVGRAFSTKDGDVTLRIDRIVRWTCWLAGIAAFAAVLSTADLRAAIPIVLGVGPVIALGAIPYLGQIALDALAWRTLLGGLGHRVAWGRLVAVRLSTEAVLQTLPGGTLVGESLKPYLLARRVPIADTVASVGVKRALLAYAESTYLALALVLGFTALAVHSRAVVGTDQLPLFVALASAGLAIAATGLVLAFAKAGIAERVRRAIAWFPSKRLRAALERKRAGFAATDHSFGKLLAQRGRLASSFAILVAAWLVEAVETYVLCRLVGIDLAPTSVLAMEACVVFARNITFFVPAGLGVQDAGYLAFFAAYGVAAPAATAFVILKRVKELAWIAIGYSTLFALDGAPSRLAENGAS